MREIRHQIIIIHKDTMKKFDQLYRKLYSNPHLGHQFYLRSWFLYYMMYFPFVSFGRSFLLKNLSRCKFYIRSYPPIVISYILQIILFPLFLITRFSVLVAMVSQLIQMGILSIIFFILLPWYGLSCCIFPKNIRLSIAYYRDMFGSNPDLNPPVIIGEMRDKLRNIVDNYRPLPSTTSFDYLRFVREKKTITYSTYRDGDGYDHEVKTEVIGSFIEFIKHV